MARLAAGPPSVLHWYMRFELDTEASPAQVLRAFTDFGERRPWIWRRTLAADKYELRELGDTWAVAREGTAGSPFWVVARYDWSDPALIRWRVVESSYLGGGPGWLRIEPRADGGSHLRTEWTATGARARDRLPLALMHRGPSSRLVARLVAGRWAATLDEYAASADGATG